MDYFRAQMKEKFHPNQIPNRPTGPSPSDIAIAVKRKLPGILYDYSESRITAGNHRANDPYRYYLFGPTFRPTIPL